VVTLDDMTYAQMSVLKLQGILDEHKKLEQRAGKRKKSGLNSRTTSVR